MRKFVELTFKEVGIAMKWKGQSVDEKDIDASYGTTLVSRSRILLLTVSFILMTAVLVLICLFTSQNNTVSNEESRRIAGFIENIFAKFFAIDNKGFFWRVTLNLILRKLAHFFEYMMLGMSIYAFLHILLPKSGRSAIVASAACSIVAVIDEFRQNFVVGRNPRIFDVLIDTSGSLIGIILAMVVIKIVWMAMERKQKSKPIDTKSRD